jgi:hypothetical protein
VKDRENNKNNVIIIKDMQGSNDIFEAIVKDIEDNKDNGITIKNIPGPKDVVGL